LDGSYLSLSSGSLPRLDNFRFTALLARVFVIVILPLLTLRFPRMMKMLALACVRNGEHSEGTTYDSPLAFTLLFCGTVFFGRSDAALCSPRFSRWLRKNTMGLRWLTGARDFFGADLLVDSNSQDS
jgi:branched-subunit amino acid permease